jgi:hypothetical protein
MKISSELFSFSWWLDGARRVASKKVYLHLTKISGKTFSEIQSLGSISPYS